MANKEIIESKNSLVEEIKDKLNNSQVLVIVKFQGISVEEVSKLRRNLRSSASDIKIYKNTLVKRALDELGYQMDEFLEGPNAFVFGRDTIEPIKCVAEFAKVNKNLEIRTGIVDKKIVTVDIINEYATIPSYEGLLSMFAGGLMEHVRNLAIGFDLYAKKLEEK
ncbi:MAG: 50S ribosomal protein L10 [Synergistaceae bacterium]|nr:50S ribosomal protein L10 [Synergistaceae bacterium]